MAISAAGAYAATQSLLSSGAGAKPAISTLAGASGGGGGGSPPDLEDLLRRSQDRLRQVMPGGPLGGRGFRAVCLPSAAVAR